MHAGLVSQIGTPDEIYENPQSVRVADFIGQANFLDCRVARDGAAARLSLGSGGECPLPAGLAGAGVIDGEAILFVRPEHLHIRALEDSGAAGGPADGPCPAVLRGRVRTVLYLGTQVRYFLQVPAQSLRAEVLVDEARRVPGVREGSEVSVGFDWQSVRLFPREQRDQLAPE
jgi:iron(III) transport system ATP-binding protein